MSQPQRMSRRREQRRAQVTRARPVPVWKFNARNRGEGLTMLRAIKREQATVVFFDPQYRELLDAMGYGNEGERQVGRASLPQMSDSHIANMLTEIVRVLRPKGYLFRWCDKYTVLEGLTSVAGLEKVDMITFKKNRIGMGRRSRYRGEYLVIYQKPPVIAKGTWFDHTISDVIDEPHGWEENYLPRKHRVAHPHRKPVSLQARLIKATTKAGNLIVDPSAGSYSVLAAAEFVGGRKFLGCDLK